MKKQGRIPKNIPRLEPPSPLSSLPWRRKTTYIVPTPLQNRGEAQTNQPTTTHILQ
jgi:hypothetical protein